MMYYAVIDTNVLVSAMLKSSSIPGTILKEALVGKITPLLNSEILCEYQEVLCREKFSFPKDTVDVLMDGLIRRGVFIDAKPIVELIPDPKDVVFYAVVMEARKIDAAYLVTGNLKHFPIKSFVVTPKEMQEILDADT